MNQDNAEAISCRITVITCSHNPRPDYIKRVVSALSVQSLEQSEWEYILIDNASEIPLFGYVDLSWHPMAKCIREDELGLTTARLRGIKESVGDILVFVDDDNVVENEFLENVKNIGEAYPFLGAWGGSTIAEFEVPPANWTRAYWPNLAIREFDMIRWSNTFDDWQAQPCGAGLCVRAIVARRYACDVSVNRIRRNLDRKGARLTGGGDTDLVYTSRDVGLGWGTFPDLRLRHLMPRERLSEPYLLRLVEGTAESIAAHKLLRGEHVVSRPYWKRALRLIWLVATRGRRSARFYLAWTRGTARGSLWQP
jgi:glycosyltransferase involved in cell wall biosynthesis